MKKGVDNCNPKIVQKMGGAGGGNPVFCFLVCTEKYVPFISLSFLLSLGFPNEPAAVIALNTIKEWLSKNHNEVWNKV